MNALETSAKIYPTDQVSFEPASQLVFKRENRSKGISTVRNLYLTTISKDVMD
jgi:hypothetical protein